MYVHLPGYRFRSVFLLVWSGKYAKGSYVCDLFWERRVEAGKEGRGKRTRDGRGEGEEDGVVSGILY